MARIDDRTEWLEADGLGGFASGTTCGVRTRRYHALLLAATTPPTGRMALVNGFDAWVDTLDGTFAVSTERYAPGVLHPDGASRIVRFDTDPWPSWHFADSGGTRVRHEIIVQRGSGAALLVWTLLTSRGPVRLRVRLLLSGRDYHSLHHENGVFRFEPDMNGAVVAFRPYDGVPATVCLSNGDYRHAPDWYRQFLYTAERERGLDDVEDLASPGEFAWTLSEPEDEAVLILKAGSRGPYEHRTIGDALALASDVR